MCALDTGDVANANRHFEEALELQPREAKALANAGLGAALVGRLDRADQLSAEALVKEPRDARSMAVRLLVLQRCGRGEGLDQLVADNPWLHHNEECLSMLGQVRLEQGRLDDAENLLNRALEAGSTNPQVRKSLATAIFLSVRDQLPDVPGAELSSNAKARLERADREISLAATAFASHEERASLHDCLANRSGIRSLLGRSEEGLRDCEAVLFEAPDHATALRNKALLLLQGDAEHESIAIMRRLRGGSDDIQLAIYIAMGHMKRDEWEQASAILEPVWDPTTGDNQQRDIADLLIRCQAILGRAEAVEELDRTIRSAWPSDPQALWILARARREQRNVDRAIDMMREALAYADPPLRDHIGIDLAETLAVAGHHAEAVELFKPLVDPRTDSPVARRYLRSLYHAGLFADALRMARDLRRDDPVPGISEVEAAVLEHLGDLQGAIEIFKGLGRKEPKVVSHRIRSATLSLLSGDEAQARENLGSILFEEIKDDPCALIRVAELRQSLHLDDVLPLAYRARKLDPRNPRAHMAYAMLFLQREEDDAALFDVDEIRVDCAVHLKASPEVDVVVILDDELPLGQQDIPSDDPRAKRLLGRRKGERIVWKEGTYERLTYEIVDVQSKYVHAAQESLASFSERFPDFPGIERIDVPADDISPILELADRRSDQAETIRRLYQTESMTLGLVAQSTGLPIIDIWAGFFGDSTQGIIAASGRAEDTQLQRECLHEADGIVLDLTALLTLAHLEILHDAAGAFRRIVVSQTTVNAINEILLTRFQGLKPSMSIRREAGQYVREELTREQQEGARAFFEGIRAFLRDECEVVPVSGALPLSRDRYDELSGLIGPEALGSILLASELGLPLVADDLRLRALAATEWSVAGAWTQDLLAELKERKCLPEDRYNDSVLQLVVANFTFVAVSAEELVHQLARDDWRVTPQFSLIVERALASPCSEDAAVSVAADLLREIWLQRTLYEQKMLILDLVLSSLTRGRPVERVALRLDAALQARFVMLQPALQLIQESLRLWLKRRQFEQGVL